MKNFGTRQVIVTDTSNTREYWDNGFHITACTARGSIFYVIMTKDTKKYKGTLQKWFTADTWNDVRVEIDRTQAVGHRITGLCYSSEKEQYLVVMTKFNIPPGQCSQWFDDTREASLATSIWLNEKFKEGFHPTIVFKDPTSNEMLVVMTEDETRSGDFVCVFHRQLK